MRALHCLFEMQLFSGTSFLSLKYNKYQRIFFSRAFIFLINLINKHWHLNTLIKQVSDLGLLFPQVSISQDSRIIYSDGTYRGAFRPSLFSNNDNKLLRDSKNSWRFKANVHRQFTACFRSKLLILKKMVHIQGL